MTTRLKLLLVEDQVEMARTILRALKGSAQCEVCTTIAEARSALESAAPYDGAILDIGLPDGSAMDLLEEVRPRRPILPVLFLTGHCEPCLVNRAFALRAQYLCKPARPEDLLAFVRTVGIVVRVEDERARTVIDAYATAIRLSPREAEVVALSAVKELGRREIAAELGVGLPTLDTHIHSILRKSERVSLQEVGRTIRELLRSAGPVGSQSNLTEKH